MFPDDKALETTTIRTLTFQFIKFARDVVENMLNLGDSNVLQSVNSAVGDCEDKHSI
jgi:hypothetical protein